MNSSGGNAKLMIFCHGPSDLPLKMMAQWLTASTSFLWANKLAPPPGMVTTTTLLAEVFNIFNRANFADPNVVVTSPDFGVITETATPGRQIQFALKLNF